MVEVNSHFSLENEEGMSGSCDLCGADDHDGLFEGADLRHPVPGRFRLVRCCSCGLVYMSPRPDDETLNAHYPEDYLPYNPTSGVQRWIKAALRRREAAGLVRLLPPTAKVLEIGCAAGDLLAPLSDLGCNVIGIEMSEYAAAYARDCLGLDVLTGRLAEHDLPAQSFDAVVMRNVIEHLPSPAADLRRVARLLKEGGRLFIATDNVASLDCRLFGEFWYGFDVPRHLVLYSPATLTAVLKRNGFAVGAVQFSLVPSHWVVSTRYVLENRFGQRAWLRRLFSLKNLPLLAALVPLTIVQRLLKNGGRMSVVATRRQRSDLSSDVDNSKGMRRTSAGGLAS